MSLYFTMHMKWVSFNGSNNFVVIFVRRTDASGRRLAWWLLLAPASWLTGVPRVLTTWSFGNRHRSLLGALSLHEWCWLKQDATVPAQWWCHQMKTFSALPAICAGNSPVTGAFPTQRPVTRSFNVFFDLHLNKRLSKQWWGWWFQMPSRPLWRHGNGVFLCFLCCTIKQGTGPLNSYCKTSVKCTPLLTLSEAHFINMDWL